MSDDFARLSSVPGLTAQLATGVPYSRIQEGLIATVETRVLTIVADSAALREIQILAVGSFGRRETFPRADLDLVLLYDGSEADGDARERLDARHPGSSAAIGNLFDQMRAAGCRVAAPVRTVAEHTQGLADDVSIATAGLDARHLCGPRHINDPAGLARSRIGEEFDGGVENFTRLIAEGVAARHARFEGAAHVLEPQLKMGRGGLRDAHAARWTAALRLAAEDWADVVEAGAVTRSEMLSVLDAYEFVARARLALHTLSRWRNDRLAFEYQAGVAGLMGYGHGDEPTAIESFMQALYHRASTLASLAGEWIARWNTSDDAPTHEVAPGVQVVAGSLRLARGEDETAPRFAARALHQIVVHGLALDPETRAALRQAAPELDPRDAAPLADAVLAPDADGLAFDELVECGAFVRVVPEWAHVVGHTSRDVYHVFTTDRHLLAAFRRIAALRAGNSDAPPFVLSAWECLVSATPSAAGAVLLATLLHDVGKGLGGAHSEIGAGMTREVARRFQMSDADGELARWLVLHHLRLSHASQRRDLQDPATVDAVLEAVPSPEHLDALVLLTWADMSSVAPTLQIGWRLELLRILHANARHGLTGSYRAARGLADRPPIAALLAAGAVTPESIAELEPTLAVEEWARMPDAEVVPVVLALARSDGEPVQVEIHLPEGNGTDEVDRTATLVVRTTDRPRLLALIAAAVAAERTNIHHARILTTATGSAIDLFLLDWVDPGGRPYDASRGERVIERVRASLAGEVTFADLRERWHSESRIAPRARPPVPTRIAHHAVAAPDLAVIEVETRDRLGLLADLCATLADLGLEIDRSIIMVEGDRAIDSFYVRVPAGDPPDLDEVCASLRQRLEDDERDDVLHR